MAVQAPNSVMAWDTGRGGAALHLRGDDGVSTHSTATPSTRDGEDAGATQRERHGQRREYNQSAQRVEARGAARRARRAPLDHHRQNNAEAQRNK
jgi:hypothetical protein